MEITHLFGARQVHKKVCLDEGLGGLVEEGHVFVDEAREIAVVWRRINKTQHKLRRQHVCFFGLTKS